MNVLQPASQQLTADDWLCTRVTPVTAIAWWGSYKDYRYDPNEDDPCVPVKPNYFRLKIWN